MATPSQNQPVKLQLSGHETFPLRQLWLSKVARYVNDCHRNGITPVLSGESAMVALGVGKNMCGSMRFWAEACCVLDSNSMELTPIGKIIFGDGSSLGLDPSCASITTQWFVHWQLASTPTRFTPIYYLFNMISANVVDRDTFLNGLVDYARSLENKTSMSSIKRSVDVCLRSYLPRLSGKGHVEDFLEPLLGELDLLSVRSRDVFSFRRTPHASLPDALFAYALLEYWDRLPYRTSSLDFSRIAYDFGSPGKVFKLDIDSINTRLTRLSDLTNESLVWTEQAGLRQVIRLKDAASNPEAFKLELLKKAYA